MAGSEAERVRAFGTGRRLAFRRGDIVQSVAEERPGGVFLVTEPFLVAVMDAAGWELVADSAEQGAAGS